MMLGTASIVVPARLVESRRQAACQGSSLQPARRCVSATIRASADESTGNTEASKVQLASTSRRALLGMVGAVAAASTMVAPAHAEGLFDDLLMKKKVANAKFLVGPIRVSRFRSGEAEKLLNTANFTGARDKLQNAALDCLTIKLANLEAYSKFREVCTLKIVGRSALEGPAGRHTPDEPIYQETAGALAAVLSDFQTIDISLEEKSAENARKGFKSLFSNLDRYEAALFAAIGVDSTLPELADARS